MYVCCDDISHVHVHCALTAQLTHRGYIMIVTICTIGGRCCVACIRCVCASKDLSDRILVLCL